MTIHVVHEEKYFAARVVYNFKQVAKAILLSFDKPYENHERLMILIYDAESDKWIEVNDADKRNPKLFGQVLYKLKNVVNNCVQIKENRVLL